MRRLILVVGGHAHLEVLRQAAARRFVRSELVLVSPYPLHHYSGMVPGYLQGTYAEGDLAFDLPAISRAGGVRFVEASVERVDPEGRWAEVDEAHLACDLVSSDVGGAPAGYDKVPGAHEHSVTVRPITKRGELKTLKFKSTLRWNLREDRQTGSVVTHAVLKTVAAFLNTEGGDLLIGVADDGAIVGIQREQMENDDRFMRHLAHMVRNGLGDRAGTCIDPKTQAVNGKSVCVVSCQRSPEPVYLTEETSSCAAGRGR